MIGRSFTNGLERSLHHQVHELRSQLDSISKSLAAHGLDLNDITDEVDDAWRGARKNVKRARRNMQHDVDVLSRAVQKAPAGTGTVLAVAAAVGFGLGYIFHLSQRD